MLTQNKPHKKVNPKRQKRQRLVDIGKPKLSIGGIRKAEHEKLSDWENAS